MKIKNINIGLKFKPCIIAEISGNHNQNLSRALTLVDKAAWAGVKIIKLQTYKPETITINSRKKDFIIKDKNSLWNKRSLYSLYKEGSTPWEWHKKIFFRAKQKGLICFSSVFDETSVDFLESLNTPAYKISSFESNHYPLIKKVINTKKPLIISLGLNSFKEIKELISFLNKNNCKNYALLKCTSSYPAKPEDVNAKTINSMREKFKCEIGFSDHTLGIGSSLAAIANGASIIEKHFTLSSKDKGIDSKFSLDPFELKCLVQESENAWKSLGKIFYGPTKNERKYLKFRRSIYIIKNIKKNEKITRENIKIIRPNFGLLPKKFNYVLGKKASKNLAKDTPLKSSDIFTKKLI
jgi:pseudaminic acid synthase